MFEDLTYSRLHEMMMKKFNLEANYRLNLSVKLSSFDYTFDITDDAEPDIPEIPVYKSKPIISMHYNKQSEVKQNNIFDTKKALDMAIRLKALNDGFQFLADKSAPERKNQGTVTRIKTDEKGVFEMLFIAIGALIRTFLNCLRVTAVARRGSSGVEKVRRKMVNTHNEKALKASSSKGAESPTNDVNNDENENESSSNFEGLNYGGFTEEEMKAL
ncbi:hypothetical protein Tco_0756288 [Tanacetum coccineum]